MAETRRGAREVCERCDEAMRVAGAGLALTLTMCPKCGTYRMVQYLPVAKWTRWDHDLAASYRRWLASRKLFERRSAGGALALV